MRSFIVACAAAALALTIVCLPTSEAGASMGHYPIIQSGYVAYKEKGADAAVTAWLKGSPLEGSKEALSQANVLKTVDAFYGSVEGLETIARRDISERTKASYVCLHYEDGPLFARFLLFKKEQSWVVVMFEFNTDPDIVFPIDVGDWER